MTSPVMLRSGMVGVERERSPHQFEQGRMHFPECVRAYMREARDPLLRPHRRGPDPDCAPGLQGVGDRAPRNRD